MSNMHYCRFQNTRFDASECIDALRDREPLSATERNAAWEMLMQFLDWCYDEEIIDDYDNARIEAILTEEISEE